MKKTINKTIFKTIFYVLVLVITVFAIASCTPDVNGGDHSHDFHQKWDETHHFEECSCGKITDSAEHTFGWVVDTEPTYSAPGYKHKECTTCTYKTDENTIIERLIHTDGFDDRLAIDLPNEKPVVSKEKLIEFYEEERNKINYSFLCIDVSSEPENGIYTNSFHTKYINLQQSIIYVFLLQRYFRHEDRLQEQFQNSHA